MKKEGTNKQLENDRGRGEKAQNEYGKKAARRNEKSEEGKRAINMKWRGMRTDTGTEGRLDIQRRAVDT